MILVAFMPTKWRGHGSGSTKPPSDSVALGRSRGMTGSDMTKSPSDLVVSPIKRHGIGSDTTNPPSDITRCF